MSKKELEQEWMMNPERSVKEMIRERERERGRKRIRERKREKKRCGLSGE